MDRTTADLQRIEEKLDALTAAVARVEARQRAVDELVTELAPVGRAAMGAVIRRLDGWERAGWMRAARGLGRVGERVASTTTEADWDALAEGVEGIVSTVRALTQPAVLRVAGDAAAVLEQPDRLPPTGPMDVLRATREDDVQQGLAVMVEIVRHVGRAARAASPRADRRARLAAITARRRPSAPPVAPAPVAPSAPAAARAPVPAPAPAAPAEAEAGPWTEGTASVRAAEVGLALTDAHWALIRFARAEHAAHGAAPNIRRITQAGGVTTKELFALFPQAPARTLARLAGLPKPVGCI